MLLYWLYIFLLKFLVFTVCILYNNIYIFAAVSEVLLRQYFVMFVGTVSMTVKDAYYQRPFFIFLKEQTLFGKNIMSYGISVTSLDQVHESHKR